MLATSTITSLDCDRCGAPLDVPPTVRRVTCAHCGTPLTIQRNDSATWTEVAERIADNTGRIGDGVTLLTLQAELERLDREWQMQARPRPRKGKPGADSDDPLGKLIGLAVPLFAIYMIFGRGQSVFEGLLLVIVLVICGMFALRSGTVARLLAPHLSEPDYRRRRAELVQRIESLGGTL
jgi:hypothetical protein